MEKYKILMLILLTAFSGSSIAQQSKGPGTSTVDDVQPVYHALMIGVNNYDNKAWQLKYPVSDVKRLSGILQKYDFRYQNVTQLFDPSRRQIFDGIARLKNRVKPDDYVLVYVSLHGRQSASDLKYYWLAADAEEGKPASWVSVEEFISRLGTISNKNLLLIVDVCYGGKIFDSTPTILFDEIASKGNAGITAIPPPLSLKQVILFKSKTSSKAISSGTDVQEVPDKSLFAERLCHALDSYKFKYLLTSDLFQYVYKQVTDKDERTVPVYGFIRQHKKGMVGDFVFYQPAGSDTFHTPAPAPGTPVSRKTTEVAQEIEEVRFSVNEGQKVIIKAGGSIFVGPNVRYSKPAGKILLDRYPVPILDIYDEVAAYPHAALMYRVAPEKKWSFCGEACTFSAPRDGIITIEFLVNDNDRGNNKGSYSVEVLTQ